MRKLLCLAFLFLVIKGVAQTEKGTIMTGGQLLLNTNDNGSNFTFSPQFGYFFANNFAAGGELTIDASKFGDLRSTEIGIGPFARYYFLKGQAKPFVVGSAGYVSQSIRSSNSEANSSGWQMLIGGGLAAFINRNVAVETIAGYRYADFNNSEGAGGFSLSLGFQLFFNKDVVRDVKRTVTGQ
jgi:outer membrane protein